MQTIPTITMPKALLAASNPKHITKLINIDAIHNITENNEKSRALRPRDTEARRC